MYRQTNKKFRAFANDLTLVVSFWMPQTMASFFQNLYRYKQSDFKHQKENFITEIFAHCLTIDKYFQGEFLKLIGCEAHCNEFGCQTQHFDKEFGKPDVLMKINDDTIIVIECKVDAEQGYMQLERYSRFLDNQQQKNRHLIFLTRFTQDLTNFTTHHTFRHIRWYDVFDILKKSDNLLSKEFTNYLIEQKMSTEISFNRSEINAIKTIKEVTAKMDEFLIHLKDILQSYSKSKITKNKNPFFGDYGIMTKVKVGNLWLGFYQYDHNSETQICLDLQTPLKLQKRKELDSFLTLNNWETYDENGYREWYNAKGLSTFFVNDSFNVNNAKEFIVSELEKIKKWL